MAPRTRHQFIRGAAAGPRVDSALQEGPIWQNCRAFRRRRDQPIAQYQLLCGVESGGGPTDGNARGGTAFVPRGRERGGAGRVEDAARRSSPCSRRGKGWRNVLRQKQKMGGRRRDATGTRRKPLCVSRFAAKRWRDRQINQRAVGPVADVARASG